MPQFVGTSPENPRVPPLVWFNSFSKGDETPREPRVATPSKFSTYGSASGCSVLSMMSVSTSIGRTNAQYRRTRQNELPAIVGVIRKLIFGVVARVKHGALAVAVDVEHIDPAMIDDAVIGMQSHVELIALVCCLIGRKRRRGVGGQQCERVELIGGRVCGAVGQLEPAMDLGEKR